VVLLYKTGAMPFLAWCAFPSALDGVILKGLGGISQAQYSAAQHSTAQHGQNSRLHRLRRLGM
jgi:hypothetical protein